MIGQEILPSQVPYTFLDYGVTMVVLVVLGITLYYVFKTQAKVLKDHDDAMQELVGSLRTMKEELLTLVIDTRHLHESVTGVQNEMEREHGRTEGLRDAAIVRHAAEHAHILEQTKHVDTVSEKRHDVQAEARRAATAEEEAQERERSTQADFRKEMRTKQTEDEG